MRIRLRVRARRSRAGGLVEEVDGGVALKVTAPEDGQANAAAIALLAKAWSVPKSAFSVVAGATDRRKTIHLQGDPRRLMQALQQWLAEQAP